MIAIICALPKELKMCKLMLVLVLVSVICWSNDACVCAEDDPRDTLVLTHIVFRHGDRTPDDNFIYPTDPYINETYYPYGHGQLTLQGKQRAFALGKILRQRYGWFLGDNYFTDLMEGRSSGYPRAQMTLQAVQTALFPPTAADEIVKNFPWQPIPYVYSDVLNDKLIATFITCRKNMFAVNTEEENHEILKEYEKLFQYLSENTGINVNKMRLAFILHDTLRTEEEWGLKLPAWTEDVWPALLNQVASDFWSSFANSKRLRRLSIGNLLKKIVDDTLQKINGTLKPAARKMFLYSGHDVNLIAILGALGKYEYGSFIPYTAHLMFELHKIDNVFGFMIFMQDFTTSEPKLLYLENCGTFCPIDDFVKMVEDNFPGENLCSL